MESTPRKGGELCGVIQGRVPNKSAKFHFCSIFCNLKWLHRLYSRKWSNICEILANKISDQKCLLYVVQFLRINIYTRMSNQLSLTLGRSRGKRELDDLTHSLITRMSDLSSLISLHYLSYRNCEINVFSFTYYRLTR